MENIGLNIFFSCHHGSWHNLNFALGLHNFFLVFLFLWFRYFSFRMIVIKQCCRKCPFWFSIEHTILNFQSAWNQHFCDNELKALILQDVVRTFPDELYFRGQEVQDLMVRFIQIKPFFFLHIKINTSSSLKELFKVI